MFVYQFVMMTTLLSCVSGIASEPFASSWSEDAKKQNFVVRGFHIRASHKDCADRRGTMVVGSRPEQQPRLAPAVLHAQLVELRQQHAELLQRAAELLQTNVRQEQVLVDNGLAKVASMPAGAKQAPAVPRPPMLKTPSPSLNSGALRPTSPARTGKSPKRPLCDIRANEREQDCVPNDEDVWSDEDEVPDTDEVCSLWRSPRLCTRDHAHTDLCTAAS